MLANELLQGTRPLLRLLLNLKSSGWGRAPEHGVCAVHVVLLGGESPLSR